MVDLALSAAAPNNAAVRAKSAGGAGALLNPSSLVFSFSTTTSQTPASGCGNTRSSVAPLLYSVRPAGVPVGSKNCKRALPLVMLAANLTAPTSVGTLKNTDR